MMSVSGKNWEEIKTNHRLVEKIKIENNLNEIQSKLVLSRNYSKEEIYLIHNHIELNNPFQKRKDFLLACELLKINIKKKGKILIVGDYDVDGCMSTILLVNFLKKIKSDVDYYIPDRFKDGYGASKRLITSLTKQHDPDLIILLDCGSNSFEAINYLREKNIQTLIIDHHNTTEHYPQSDVFINPQKTNDNYKFKYLCASYLTYLFIDLYIKINKLNYPIKDQLILVLVATVADVMPIRDINKFLAKKVLNDFDVNKNISFKHLLKILNIKRKLELHDIGFKIAPLINAAGRITNANQVVELFTTSSTEKIKNILENIFYLNEKRKFIEKKILNELDYKNFYNEKGIIFFYKPNLHEGIIGIIASRIKEYFNKPCLVLTNSKNIIKGSARSTSNFNIGKFIEKSLKLGLIINGGGHNLAAGVSLEKKKINLFKKYINESFDNKIYKSNNIFTSTILLDAININFANSIETIGPFGNKNTRPIFLLQNVKFTKQTINNNYVECFVKKGAKMIRSVSFHHIKSKINYEILNSNNNFDIFVKIKINKWNNKSSIGLEIIDLIKKN
ncbi:single-stranded-DNA-specific exonuclease RecJ [Candidatus Pelagibacter sp.]|nr:single-stranded-DNA-specific exonuclease RecJ [Candidatus Pelagibacter sp.]